MGRHLWVECNTCSEPGYYGGRVSSGGWIHNEDGTSTPCPDCFGRGGFWEDDEDGFHMYHDTDERNTLDPKSDYNNRKDDN